ncbi:MAG TPA: DUF5946 family protein [Steroidobacteraceae bacterium]
MASEQDAYDELRYYTLARHDAAFIHQHVVNVFTAQRATDQTKPIALTFSLVGLYFSMEKGFSGREVQRVHTKLASIRQTWPVFTLPLERGLITVFNVMAAPAGIERDAVIHAWCRSVWEAFHGSHQLVVDLLLQRGIR